jgi:hypothetical protein
MIGQRISSWLELSFWQLVVRSLTVAQFVARQAVLRTRQAKSLHPRPISSAFSFQLFNAVAGWACGLLAGYLLSQWLF